MTIEYNEKLVAGSQWSVAEGVEVALWGMRRVNGICRALTSAATRRAGRKEQLQKNTENHKKTQHFRKRKEIVIMSKIKRNTALCRGLRFGRGVL